MSKNLQRQTAFPGARVLVVDDEKTLRHTLSGLLQRVGYEAETATSGKEALHYLAKHSYDVVLLDLKMPEMDGTEVLKRTHRDGDGPIFIVMTAYGTLESAILGIRCGAHDYLLKPSSIDTILNTIEAGLAKREEQRQRQQDNDPIDLLERALANLKQRSEPSESEPEQDDRFLNAPGIFVDLKKHLVLIRDEPAHLTKTEFNLLIYLMQHPNEVLSPAQIVEHLRGYEMDKQEASTFLRSHIHRLRQKIEPDPSQPRLIQTVRGRGYRFDVAT